MKSTDVMCPICGAINYGLFLEETDGWMECEHCGSMSHLLSAGAGDLTDAGSCLWQVLRPLPRGKRSAEAAPWNGSTFALT